MISTDLSPRLRMSNWRRHLPRQISPVALWLNLLDAAEDGSVPTIGYWSTEQSEL
jgi:hypothetical protein